MSNTTWHPKADQLCDAGFGPAAIRDALEEDGHVVSYDTIKTYVRRRRQRAGELPAATVELDGGDADVDDQLAEARELIERARAQGLTPRSVRIETGGSDWDAQTKGGGITELQSRRRRATVTVAAGEVEAVPEIRQATPVEVVVRTPRRLPARRETAGRWAVIMPDAQRPFVDHSAVDVAHQILADVQAEHGVDAVVHLGDDLDLPDLGRHRSAPAALGRIQEAIDDQYRTLAVERALCPDAEIVWLAGNHDARLVNWLTDHAPQLIGLTRAGDDPATPVLSVPYLCRLDELEVTYLEPYPDADYWLTDNLRCIHGDLVGSAKGQTGAKYLARGDVSTIYGHIHRSELVYQTRNTRNGPRTYLAGSPGTLCRIDGPVPSAKTGITSTGGAGMTRYEDWQQGVWVVWYDPDETQLYTVEPVQIWGGWAMWRGREYLARVDADGHPVA